MSIEKFFAAIRDGAWHSVDELSEKLGVQSSKLDELSNSLSERGLITYEEKTRSIKLQPFWRLLLPEEQQGDPENIVETFMVPSQASIDVQSIHISNISNVDLAVSVCGRKKIREITIAA